MEKDYEKSVGLKTGTAFQDNYDFLSFARLVLNTNAATKENEFTETELTFSQFKDEPPNLILTVQKLLEGEQCHQPVYTVLGLKDLLYKT